MLVTTLRQLPSLSGTVMRPLVPTMKSASWSIVLNPCAPVSTRHLSLLAAYRVVARVALHTAPSATGGGGARPRPLLLPVTEGFAAVGSAGAARRCCHAAGAGQRRLLLTSRHPGSALAHAPPKTPLVQQLRGRFHQEVRHSQQRFWNWRHGVWAVSSVPVTCYVCI